MIRNYTLPKKAILMVVPMFLLLLASCGSYQYSGYEDGIYGDSQRQPTTSKEQSQYANNQDQGNSYYKNLFSEKSEIYGQMADDIVFTDVESYSSAEAAEDEIYYEDQQAYVGGRAPWGEDPDQYTINIYNTGFYGGLYNPYRWNRYGYGYGYGYGGYWNNPYFWDPFYGPGYWGGGLAYGYGPTWGWGTHFGYGFSFGYGGYYNPYWRRGYAYNRYYNNYYNNRYNDVAYNSGRRASYSDYSNRRENASGLRTNESSYSRSIRNIRSNQNSSRSRSYTRSRDNNSNIYSRSNRRSEPAIINNSSSRRNSAINRSNRSSRSNPTYNRSSSRSSRSSGTVRSSSSSSRSSGSRSSGGRSSSSRGGGRG